MKPINRETATGGRQMDANKTPERDAEDHLGAVEGDRPGDHPNQGNRNAPALDDQGMPNDPVAICEDAIGANVDGSEGG